MDQSAEQDFVPDLIFPERDHVHAMDLLLSFDLLLIERSQAIKLRRGWQRGSDCRQGMDSVVDHTVIMGAEVIRAVVVVVGNSVGDLDGANVLDRGGHFLKRLRRLVGRLWRIMKWQKCKDD